MANLGQKFDPEILTRQEVAAILRAFPPSRTGVRNRALTAMYLGAQLRCNECLDLRPTNVSWESCTVTVLRGKGGKRRVAGIPREILDTYIQPWLEIRPASPYLFCTHKGQRLHDSYIRRMLKRQAEKAGIVHRVHCHGLRHSGAFHLAQAGADIRHIQKQLGHSSLAVTDRYLAHLGADEAPRAISGVNWIGH